jgi:hypothetical protein
METLKFEQVKNVPLSMNHGRCLNRRAVELEKFLLLFVVGYFLWKKVDLEKK